MILNCALKGSNITNTPVNWELVTLRLTNLKSFIEQVITIHYLKEILFSQIDNILSNSDFQEIYIENEKQHSNN